MSVKKVVGLHRTSKEAADAIVKHGFRCSTYPKILGSPYSGKCGVFFSPSDYINDLVRDTEQLDQEMDERIEAKRKEVEEDRKDVRLQQRYEQMRTKGRTVTTSEDELKRLLDEYGDGSRVIVVELDEDKVRVGEGLFENTLGYSRTVLPYSEYEQKKNYKYPEIFYEPEVRPSDVIGVYTASELVEIIKLCDSDNDCLLNLR